MAEEPGMLDVNRLSKQFCQSAHSMVFRDADKLCTGSHDFIEVMEAFRCFFLPSFPSLFPFIHEYMYKCFNLYSFCQKRLWGTFGFLSFISIDHPFIWLLVCLCISLTLNQHKLCRVKSR